MFRSVKTAPPNSMFVIVDPDNRVKGPDWSGHDPLASTEACVYGACYPEVDGETQFTLGSMRDVDPGMDPVFDGTIKTPNRKISLETSHREPILSATTKGQETKLRIWTNHPRFPDKVIVGID